MQRIDPRPSGVAAPEENAPRGRTLSNVVIILFLAAQVLIPIYGFRHDPNEVLGWFTWNMYSMKEEVQAQYFIAPPQGPVRRIDYKSHFNARDRATGVFHHDVLPRFHAYLCEAIKKENPQNRLVGKVRMRISEGEPIEIVSLGPDGDLCSSPNYGVNFP